MHNLYAAALSFHLREPDQRVDSLVSDSSLVDAVSRKRGGHSVLHREISPYNMHPIEVYAFKGEAK